MPRLIMIVVKVIGDWTLDLIFEGSQFLPDGAIVVPLPPFVGLKMFSNMTKKR